MAVVTSSIGTTGRDYSTITAFEADLDDVGIYGSGDDAVGECYDDSPFDESVTIDGGGTVGLASVTLTVAEGHRHDGTAGTGGRIVTMTALGGLGALALSGTTSRIVTVEWIEVDGAEIPGSNSSGMSVSAPLSRILRSIVHGVHSNGAGSFATGILNTHNVSPGAGLDLASGCIIYNVSGGGPNGDDARGIAYGSRVKHAYNCTVHGVAADSNNDPARGISAADIVGHVFRNCLVSGVTNAGTDEAVCFSPAAPVSATMDHNASSDATATGTGSLTNIVTADQFVSTVEGSEDLHLKAGADLIDAGMDLGTTPTGVEVDIDGRDRDAQDDTWDIGAHEYGSKRNVTVRAIGPGGTSDADLTIYVQTVVPPFISYNTMDETWYENYGDLNGNEINLSPHSDGDVVSYSITSGSLPAGVVLNSSTGVITGIPTALKADEVVEITATGPGGTSAHTISIEVLVLSFLTLFPTGGATPLITEYDAAQSRCWTDAAADLESTSSQYFEKTSPSVTALNGAAKMTVRFSIKPESGVDITIVGRFGGSQNQFKIDHGSDQRFYVHVPTSLTDSATFFRTNNNFAFNSQHECVLIYDGTQDAADRVKFYVGGVLQAGVITGTLPPTMTTSTAPIFVGTTDGLSLFGDGVQQCVGISSQALSGAALTAAHTPTFYADQAATRQAEWLSFWNLCERTGLRVDSRGLNDLTAVNSPGVAAGPAEGNVVNNAPCKRVDAVAGVESDKPLLQATVANQPTWIENGGDPYLNGDGSSSYSQTAAFSTEYAQPNVVFVRAKRDVTTASQLLFDGIDINKRHAQNVLGGGENEDIYAGVDLQTDAADTDEHNFTAKFNGASSQLRRGGVLYGAPGNAGTHALTGLTIMARLSGDTAFMNGRIYHIAIVSGDLSDEEMEAGEGAL